MVTLIGFFLLPFVSVLNLASLTAPQAMAYDASSSAGLLWMVPIAAIVSFLVSNVGWLVGMASTVPHVSAGTFNALAGAGLTFWLILGYATAGYGQAFIGSGYWAMLVGMVLVALGGLVELLSAFAID
jgi:hypothetical protein